MTPSGGGTLLMAGSTARRIPDHCHNAEQPSCGKCARLASRPWKWEELDPAQQARFFAEAQAGSAWAVADEDIARQVVDASLTPL